ncbi:MAG: hypothetical protein RML12_10720 [Xanthomonadales bacterium]|nr:hypothetical protein [Xanthomonadales bacterium]
MACALPARAAVPLELEGTSLPPFELALLDYQPGARRVVAQSVIGNLACAPASESIPSGAFSLRLDGRDYRLSPVSGGSILRYDLASGRIRVRLTRFDELPAQSCASTGSSTAGLRLRLNQEVPLALAQGAVYRTATPRRLEARVSEPVICFDFGASGGNLRLDLTDANGQTIQIPNVQAAGYAHGDRVIGVELPPQADCFGFGGGASGPSTPDQADRIFASGIEEEEIFPDLAVAVTEVPTALEQEFSYRIEVRNRGLGAAAGVRVSDFYPKTGSPRFVDGTVNWSCTAHGGASCGSAGERRRTGPGEQRQRPARRRRLPAADRDHRAPHLRGLHRRRSTSPSRRRRRCRPRRPIRIATAATTTARWRPRCRRRWGRSPGPTASRRARTRRSRATFSRTTVTAPTCICWARASTSRRSRVRPATSAIR